MKFTEWDKFNEDETLCRKVGCQGWNISVCCPELMTSLCRSKEKLLKRLNIKEIDLEKNKITVDYIKNKLQEKSE